MPCDYCKGRRDYVLVTQFREESGQKRCLVSEKRNSEPCGKSNLPAIIILGWINEYVLISKLTTFIGIKHYILDCKQGVTTQLVCLNNDSLMRRMIHRRQISCTECSTKTIEVPERKIREYLL